MGAFRLARAIYLIVIGGSDACGEKKKFEYYKWEDKQMFRITHISKRFGVNKSCPIQKRDSRRKNRGHRRTFRRRGETTLLPDVAC